MKRFTYYMIAVFAIFIFLGMESCKHDNEEPSIEGPIVQAPSGIIVMIGKEVTLDFQISAPGKIGSVTVSASEGEAVLEDPSAIIGQMSGTASVTYTAPLTDGIKTVTLVVEDQQSTPKSVTVDAEVTVTSAAQSDKELLVAKCPSAPAVDGNIDDLWLIAQKLVGTVKVPLLPARGTYLNPDGEGIEESMGLFEPYSGESEDFTMRAGYYEDSIYFLLEWNDDADSKDRMSWYFDPQDKLWKQEHKYANSENDKFYEDKFAMLFPIGTVDGFESQTCYATCHQGLDLVKDMDKHTRHYLTTDGQKIDMWHWKRVRGAYAGQLDDQKIEYVAPPYNSSSNGRHGDSNGEAGYASNVQTLSNGTDNVNVPKYIIPDATNYYWITQDDIDNGTAKLVTAVDGDGILTYDGGTIDPNGDDSYAQGTGDKRFPSVTIKAFTGARADIDIKAVYTGSGWVCEFKRKLNTGDEDDVVFDVTKEFPFGLAIFNNAAIAHAIKPGLLLKFEQ